MFYGSSDTGSVVWHPDASSKRPPAMWKIFFLVSIFAGIAWAASTYFQQPGSQVVMTSIQIPEAWPIVPSRTELSDGASSPPQLTPPVAILNAGAGNKTPAEERDSTDSEQNDQSAARNYHELRRLMLGEPR